MMLRVFHVAVLVAGLVVLSAPGGARADTAIDVSSTEAAHGTNKPSALGRTFFLPAGLNLGGAMGPHGRFHVGGELSAVWTAKPLDCEQLLGWFWGLYADGLYVPGKGGRFTAGPEVGWSILGVDGGYELITDGSSHRQGFAVRAFTHVPTLYVTLYARGHYVETGHPFFDFGILLKVPLGFRPRHW